MLTNREIAIVVACNAAEKLEEHLDLSNADIQDFLDIVEQAIKQFLQERVPE